MSQDSGIAGAKQIAFSSEMHVSESPNHIPSHEILPSISPVDDEEEQLKDSNRDAQNLILVTVHLSSSNRPKEEPGSYISTSRNRKLTDTDVADVVRTMAIPVAALQQREKEMRQIAKSLNIPTSRWNGSLLYTEYQKHLAADESKQNGRDKTRIVLRLFHDSVAKWSINSNSDKLHCDDAKTLSTNHGNWFGSRIQPQIDFDWIQTYFSTGRIHVPSTARGFDILWLLDYFKFIYQPDQCHFASFAVYERVQLWTKYYCYIRPNLIDWISAQILNQKQDGEMYSSFPLLFGTTNMSENCIELGTQRLQPLGDLSCPSAVTTGYCRSKRSMADMAMKIFNSITHVDQSAVRTSLRHQNQDGSASCADETQTTIPCPEECTAAEMRNDFCNFLMHHIRENDSLAAYRQNYVFNVQFTVRPVTVHYSCDEPSSRSNGQSNSNSSGSFQATNDSDVVNNLSDKVLYNRYRVVHRAVLVIDLQPLPTKHESHRSTPNSCSKTFHTISDFQLNAPVDELLEEDFAKRRLKEPREVNVSEKPGRRVTINENLSFEKENPLNFTDRNISSKLSPSLTLADGVKLNLSDLNLPHDELNASMDSGNISLNASMGLVSSNFSSVRKRKKPKPVFELPDKLLGVDVEETHQMNNVPPQLARMKHPIVKSSGVADLSRIFNDSPRLPGPITIVRRGTYDNTVTSALTGPFYIDDNGILRDVFENGGADSDDDYDGDEDTRAQARRHEWIQTALMNRGIGERMESLLKESETTNNNESNFDPWDFLTGLNLCELSHEVLRSFEQYTNSIVRDNFIGVTFSATAEGVNAAAPDSTIEATPTQGKKSVQSSDVLVSASVNVEAALDEQSREDEPFDSVAQKIIVPIDLDNREDGTRSQSSKESPREVQTFDCMTSTSSEKLLNEVAHIVTDEPAMMSNGSNNHLSNKKSRGIKGLFRRKKIDPTADNSSK